MKRKIAILIAAAALFGTVLVTAALGQASSASAQASKGTFVALGRTPLGRVLVDARGRTLYLFENDKHGKSACYGACAAYWPPLLSTVKPRPGKGVRASLLGSTKRTDGKRQVTYAGHPLYTFAGDTAPGQTNGQGKVLDGGLWTVASAAGAPVANANPPSAAPAAPVAPGY